MTSNALQQLYDEHDSILAVVDHMRTLLNSPDLQSHADELRWILSFLREYGDGYHHGKEEDLLFPQLSQASPMFASLVDSLADHHALFREMLQRAERALAAEEWPLLGETLNTYASDLCDHISAENDELFVAAEEMLGDDEKERISFLFADRDRERGEARKLDLENHVASF
jgi:hemerythrin-like domain-containing protein